MMEISKLEKTYADDITTLWNDNFMSPFKVDKEQILGKIFNDPDFYKEGSFCLKEQSKILGFIVTKLNRGNLSEYQNCAWLSVIVVDKKFQQKGYGLKLYRAAEDKLRSIGIKQIHLGGEINNFFSGIPQPSEYGDRFFKGLGYEVNEGGHYDLTNDISKFDFDNLNIKINNDSTYSTTVMTTEERDELNIFFDRCFPGRWKYEINKYIDEDGDLRNVLLFKKDNKVYGFCKVYSNEDPSKAHRELGLNWGALGPIGIDETLRGQGLGNRLLHDSLKYLRDRGTGYMIIDWTVLTGFYGQFGFTPWKTYHGGYKDL